MVTIASQTSGNQPPAETAQELAQRLFQEFYASCFWHYRPDLPITENEIPLIVQGLRHHGGRKGLQAAAQLMSMQGGSGPCR